MKHLSGCCCFVLIGLGLSACDETRTRPARTDVAFVHAAPTQPIIRFRREEALEAELNYLGSSSDTFDIDIYDFHFDITPAGGESERRVSFVQELAADTEYTIVATEIDGEFQQLILTAPALASDTSGSQTALLHLAPSLGELDVYVEAPGTDITSAAPFGTIGFRESLPPVATAAAEYDFTITEAGNPAAVLLRSAQFQIGAGVSLTFTIVDSAGSGTAPLSVIVSGDASFSFVDGSLDASIRVLGAMQSIAAIDVGLDGNLSPPLIPGLVSGTVSDYVSIEPGGHTLTVTPEGNPSVTEVDAPFDAPGAEFSTFFISGPTGMASIQFAVDDYRPIEGEAKLNLYNAAQGFTLLDIFVAVPGTDLTGLFPTAGLLPGGSTPNTPLAAGDYEVTIRSGGTETVLAGPTPITVAAGGFYSVLMTDGAGGATVDLTLLDDFN